MNKNILALSVAAAALATSASAAVSSNIVGYVKISLNKGLNLICNPLNNTAPQGNDADNLFKGLSCSVLQWTGTGFISTDYDSEGGRFGGENFALAPGTAVFVDVENATSLTTVGDALTGTQTKAINTGNNFVGSLIPISGPIDTSLGLSPTDGSAVLTWTGTGYTAYNVAVEEGTTIWLDGIPDIAVAQGFVVQTTTPFTWTKTFVVP
jgi:hypothetical protein